MPLPYLPHSLYSVCAVPLSFCVVSVNLRRLALPSHRFLVHCSSCSSTSVRTTLPNGGPSSLTCAEYSGWKRPEGVIISSLNGCSSLSSISNSISRGDRTCDSRTQPQQPQQPVAILQRIMKTSFATRGLIVEHHLRNGSLEHESEYSESSASRRQICRLESKNSIRLGIAGRGRKRNRQLRSLLLRFVSTPMMFGAKLRQFRGIKDSPSLPIATCCIAKVRCCSVSLGFKMCSYLQQTNSLDRRTNVTNIVQGLMRTTIHAGRMRACS